MTAADVARLDDLYALVRINEEGLHRLLNTYARACNGRDGMGLDAFRQAVAAGPVDEDLARRLFRAFNTSHTGYISYREVCHVLCM